MNKDQGKPSERIISYSIEFNNGLGMQPLAKILDAEDVKREADDLHDRLVSAEAELQELKFSLSNGDYSPKSPTKDAPKPGCWDARLANKEAPKPRTNNLDDRLREILNQMLNYGDGPDETISAIKEAVRGLMPEPKQSFPYPDANYDVGDAFKNLGWNEFRNAMLERLK